VGASASIDARQYFGHAELNWTDWNLGGFGRYDIDSRTNVEARYRHYREHLDVYNFDVQSAGIVRPVPYDSDEVQVTGTTRFNRFGLTGIGLYRTFRSRTSTSTRVRNFTSRNSFDTMIGAVAGSYAFAPGRFITGIVRLQDISYIDDAPRNPLNPAAVIPRDRDSFSWVALAGFEYDFDGVWAGRIGFGWQQRNYRGAQIKTLEGPAVEGRLSWSPVAAHHRHLQRRPHHRGVDPAERGQLPADHRRRSGGPRIPAERHPRRRGARRSPRVRPAQLHRHGRGRPAQRAVVDQSQPVRHGQLRLQPAHRGLRRGRESTTATSSRCGYGLPSDLSAGPAPVRLLGVEFAGLRPDEVVDRVAARARPRPSPTWSHPTPTT
jgi:hypothetical protein